MRRVDHIGVVTDHPSSLIAVLRDVFGLEVGEPKEIPKRGIRVAKVRAENITIEVISPLNKESEVSRFI